VTKRNLTLTTALASGLLLATGAMAQTTDLGAQGFSISFGDEVIAGATPPYREGLAPADAALQRLDMAVQFDTLRQERVLNVLTEDMREAYAAGEEVRFRASMNYPAFVNRAEVDVVPVAPNGASGWVMPAGGPADLAYVLRVYDAWGRFDETHPVILRRTADPSDAPALNAAYRQLGEGEDRTARRNIPVRGGTVIVSGQNAVPGDTVTVAGDEVMVDGSGRFVVSRIVPVGDNIIEVEAYGRRILRDVYVPQSDWFRTGLIDITMGYADGALYGDRGHYLDGRMAFYVSGITASGWRVTASADTEYGPDLGGFHLRRRGTRAHAVLPRSLRRGPAPPQRRDNRGRQPKAQRERLRRHARQSTPARHLARHGRIALFPVTAGACGRLHPRNHRGDGPRHGLRRGHPNAGRRRRLSGRSPAGRPDPDRAARKRHLGRYGGLRPLGGACPEPRGAVRIPSLERCGRGVLRWAHRGMGQ
jgi:hypothetical protein